MSQAIGQRQLARLIFTSTVTDREVFIAETPRRWRHSLKSCVRSLCNLQSSVAGNLPTVRVLETGLAAVTRPDSGDRGIGAAFWHILSRRAVRLRCDRSLVVSSLSTRQLRLMELFD